VDSLIAGLPFKKDHAVCLMQGCSENKNFREENNYAEFGPPKFAFDQSASNISIVPKLYQNIS
jgi:hypothetical protein